MITIDNPASITVCNAANSVILGLCFTHDYHCHVFVKADITKESKSTTALTFKLWHNTTIHINLHQEVTQWKLQNSLDIYIHRMNDKWKIEQWPWLTACGIVEGCNKVGWSHTERVNEQRGLMNRDHSLRIIHKISLNSAASHGKSIPLQMVKEKQLCCSKCQRGVKRGRVYY